MSSPLPSGPKVRSLADAVVWREELSGSVAFTNGVFDLVHPGHVRVVEAARSEADHLIVAINSDDSVRSLGKGAGRPINDERSRAAVIAAFESVDCVVIFPESTPLELIQKLAPDVLVKGGDYRPDQIVGSDLVTASGGRVIIVPLLADQSTTRLVERLRASP